MPDALPATLAGIDNAWRATLPNTPGVQARLDAQDYLGAVNAAIGRGVILGAAQQAQGEDWTHSLPLIADAAPGVMPGQTIFGIALPAPDEPVEVRTKVQLLWDKSLQSIILFILVAIGGLSMYHATFVGNLDDALKNHLLGLQHRHHCRRRSHRTEAEGGVLSGSSRPKIVRVAFEDEMPIQCIPPKPPSSFSGLQPT